MGLTRLVTTATFPSALPSLRAARQIFHCKQGVVFYRQMGAYWVMAGEPLAKSEELQQELFACFVETAQSERKIVCGYYFERPQWSKTHWAHKLGVTCKMDLQSFDPQGAQRSELRRALRCAARRKYHVSEEDVGQRDVIQSQLVELYQKWLAGRPGPRIGFLLSGPKKWLGAERCFVLRWHGRIYAYATVLPFSQGFYLDQMVRDPDSPSFVMDFLIISLFLKLKEEGHQILDLGLTPFVGFKPQTMLEKLLSLQRHLKVLYRSQGLLHFKRKYCNIEQPGYLLIDRRHNSLIQLIVLAVATYSQ